MSQPQTNEPSPPPKAARDRQRRLARWIRRAVVFVVLGLAVTAIVVALLPKPVVVSIVPVARGPMSVTVEEDGQTRVRDRFVISAPLTGRVARIALHAGDAVAEGDPLARLLPMQPQLLDERSRREAEARLAAAQASAAQSRSAIERARVSLEIATTKADRDRRLFAQRATTQATLEESDYQERARKEELESAILASKVADREVQVARSALGHVRAPSKDGEELVLASPITGSVLRVVQESEGVVQAGAPLLELGNPTALEIVADVLTRDAVHIQRGAPVSIDRWGGASALRGHVRRVEPSAFTRVSSLGVEEQRVNVIVDLDSPQEEWDSLGDGYRVEVAIQTWHSPDATQVPSSSVFRHGEAWAVFVAAGGVAQLRPIQIGHRNERSVEVESGLAVGEHVISHPGNQIRDGIDVVAR